MQAIPPSTLSFSSLGSLAQTVARHQLAARKALGQHFLLDQRITDEIVRYAGPLSGVQVIEIGPGPGGLTRSLLAAGARQVIVIEKDARCIAVMEELRCVAGERLRILHADALEVDLVHAVPAPRRVVANLPYNAGTAMLLHWLDAIHAYGPEAFASLTLMFQKEVAERIVAPPGGKEYGRLSVISQWLCECRMEMELPPELFSPPPKVSSAVVTLTPRAAPLAAVDKGALEAIVAKAFGQRRKMLRSALKGLPVPADRLLAAAGIDGGLRAEQLTVEALCAIAIAYKKELTFQGRVTYG